MTAARKYEPCPDGCPCGRHRKPHNALPPGQSKANRLAYNRDYMARVRAADPAHAETERARNLMHGRRYALKSRYGLSLEQWAEMFERQEGNCYLCGEGLPEATNVCLDHDHSCCPGKRSCGKCIRGLACRWCNQGIGQFRDDPAKIRRAADALEAANRRIRLAS